MPIPVVDERIEDPELRGSLWREHCVFCRKPTHFWTNLESLKRDQIACCPPCAENHRAKDLPSKWYWCHVWDLAKRVDRATSDAGFAQVRGARREKTEPSFEGVSGSVLPEDAESTCAFCLQTTEEKAASGVPACAKCQAEKRKKDVPPKAFWKDTHGFLRAVIDDSVASIKKLWEEGKA